MLSKYEIHVTLPAKDMTRAKAFYTQKLGFSIESETPAGLTFHGAGSWFRVFPSSGASNGSFTQAGWETKDIEAEVAELKKRGVVFEEYNYPTLKTVNGIASTPEGRAAWFKDSEGNLLGIVQG
jgi:predicted enzyme related to lactoylglutathione lyase